MTTISSADLRSARAGSWSRLFRLIRGGADVLATYWMRRDAIKTLRQLDDRALRDIGISRCHIEGAVSGDLNLELVRVR